MLTWAVVLADALITLHLAFPSPATRPFAAALLPRHPPSYAPPDLSPSHQPPHPDPDLHSLLVPSLFLILAATLAAAGSALRVACFRALGPLFTFELTISPGHELVVHGPYAYVRHPSYTGVYATLLGASGVMLAPGAWLREAWLAPSLRALLRLSASTPTASLEANGARCASDVGGALLAWTFAAFWTAKVAYALKSTNRRVLTEDGELRRVFGLQWEDWAARVRWRLLPGVY